MSFQGYQGDVNPQVEHKIPGADEGAHMMHLSQVQLAQIVRSAVSQALTQYTQHTSSNPPLSVAASAAVVQPAQFATNFEDPRSRVIVQEVG